MKKMMRSIWNEKDVNCKRSRDEKDNEVIMKQKGCELETIALSVSLLLVRKSTFSAAEKDYHTLAGLQRDLSIRGRPYIT